MRHAHPKTYPAKEGPKMQQGKSPYAETALDIHWIISSKVELPAHNRLDQVRFLDDPPSQIRRRYPKISCGFFCPNPPHPHPRKGKIAYIHHCS